MAVIYPSPGKTVLAATLTIHRMDVNLDHVVYDGAQSLMRGQNKNDRIDWDGVDI